MSVKAAKCFGYCRHSDAQISFVLPVFRKKKGADAFIQVPSLTLDRTASFRQINLSDESFEAVRTTHYAIARVGGPMLYAVVNKEQIHIGPTIELAPVLWELSNLPAAGSGFALQVAELCGNLEEKLEARHSIASDLENSLGSRASSQFIANSVSLEAVWQLLVQYTSHEKLPALWERRSELVHSVDVRNDSIIPDAAQKWLQQELLVDVDAVIRDARASLPLDDMPQSKSRPTERAFELPTDPIGDEIRAIRKAGRQELRIAKIIRRLIENPGFGEKILEEYKDKANFANKVILFLRQNSDRFSFNIDGMFAQYLVSRIFTMCYAKQRGILLHELAVELGEYPAFAKAIREQLRRSYSEAVSMAKSAILEQLENPGERRGRVYAPSYEYYY